MANSAKVGFLSQNGCGVWVSVGCMLLSAAAYAEESPQASPMVVSDPVTSALMQKTLQQPEVGAALQAGALSGNAHGGGSRATGGSRMIEVQEGHPVTANSSGSSHLVLASLIGDGNLKAAKRMGADVRIGVPLGLGVEFHYHIIAPLKVGLAVDTSALAVAVSAEATVNILPIFVDTHWELTVTVGFTHIQFTGLADSTMAKFNPYLSEQGVDANLSGVGLNAITLLGGFGYVTEGGFHFSVAAGRLIQIGRSSGEDDNGPVLSHLNTLMVQIALGYEF
jgi:hypothetical protein